MIGKIRHKITTRHVARFLTKLMLLHGISQRELGRQSGVDQKTINNLVREISLPRVETLDMLVAPFGLEAWEALLPEGSDPSEMHELVDLFVDLDGADRRSVISMLRDLRHAAAAKRA